MSEVESMRTFGFRFPKEREDLVLAAAGAADLPVSAWLRDAIEKALDDELRDRLASR